MNKPPSDFGKIEPRRVKFEDALSGLCALELSAAHGNPERIGAMIERLVNSLAFTIVIVARGDPKQIDEVLTGATSYLYETAAGNARVGAFMADMKRTTKP